MSEFTASNNLQVRIQDNKLGFRRPAPAAWSMLCGNDVVDAVREFFKAEDDDRLERWRWPEHPEYVVYPKKHRVLNEATGESWRIAPFADSNLTDLARAAFEAWHDARFPKPWREAKNDEVWAVTRCGGAEHPMVVEGDAFVDLKPGEGGRRLAFQRDDKLIQRAHRIWPEESK